VYVPLPPPPPPCWLPARVEKSEYLRALPNTLFVAVLKFRNRVAQAFVVLAGAAGVGINLRGSQLLDTAYLMDALYTYRMYVAIYIGCGALLSFVYLYIKVHTRAFRVSFYLLGWFVLVLAHLTHHVPCTSSCCACTQGPPTNPRTHHVIQAVVVLVGAVCLFFSSTFLPIQLGMMATPLVASLLLRLLSRAGSSCGCSCGCGRGHGYKPVCVSAPPWHAPSETRG